MHVVNEKRALPNWKKNDIKLKQTYITKLLHVNQHTWTMIMKLRNIQSTTLLIFSYHENKCSK